MMTRNLFTAALGIALCITAPGVRAERLIREFSGDANANTAEFSVQAPWIVDWLVSGDPGQFEVVNIALVNADTGAYEGVAVKTKTAGNGVRLFDTGGRFYFRVEASMMDWHLKVIQLTPEEAKAYTPR